MKLTLKRDDFRSTGIFGQLLDEAGTRIAVTLEHSYILLSTFEPKIPDGIYTCVRGEHQLHNGILFNTFEITGVYGHSGLLFHSGNFNRDSEGCVLLGQTVDGDMVTHSKRAFADFMALLDGLQMFTLEVI